MSAGYGFHFTYTCTIFRRILLITGSNRNVPFCSASRSIGTSVWSSSSRKPQQKGSASRASSPRDFFGGGASGRSSNKRKQALSLMNTIQNSLQYIQTTNRITHSLNKRYIKEVEEYRASRRARERRAGRAQLRSTCSPRRQELLSLRDRVFSAQFS